MKALEKLFVLFFIMTCLFAVSEKTFAQDDYIVTVKGDTIRGSIKIQDPSSIKFQSTADKQKHRYSPESLLSFYTVKKGNYKSIHIPDRKGTFFLQLLEGDYIKLYEFLETRTGVNPYMGGGGGMTMSFSNTKLKYWYAQKADSLVNIKTNQLWWGDKQKRTDSFYDLIKDNEAVAKKYKTEDKFSFNFIRSLIKEYNGTPSN